MPSIKPYKPILCLDFDGVIHSYEKGWQDGEIYGTVTEGFWPWLEEAVKHFDVVVYSSRCQDPNMVIRVSKWLEQQWQEYLNKLCLVAPMPDIAFAFQKPKAFLTIDDRALTFKGRWEELNPAQLRAFKPWNAELPVS